MTVGVIYALLDPDTNRIRYIGLTKNAPEKRLAEHIAEAGSNLDHHRPVCAWIRTLNGRKPKIIVLEHCATTTELMEAEKRLIAGGRLLGLDLLNSGNGGEGVFSGSCSRLQSLRHYYQFHDRYTLHRYFGFTHDEITTIATDHVREKAQSDPDFRFRYEIDPADEDAPEWALNLSAE